MQGKVMKHISMTSQSCSACTACTSVCPKSAILFSVDEEGFKVPVVDENLCVDCGLCIKICPALNTKDSVNDISSKAYALQYHDEAVRNRSASGALFPAFANYFINTLHGYVCGANSTSKCKITKYFCKSTLLALRNLISFLVSH